MWLSFCGNNKIREILKLIHSRYYNVTAKQSNQFKVITTLSYTMDQIQKNHSEILESVDTGSFEYLGYMQFQSLYKLHLPKFVLQSIISMLRSR